MMNNKKYFEESSEYMKFKIERMNHTGEGIAKYNDIVFFIPKTIPGDVVEVKEKDIIHHKNYNQVLEYKIIKTSEKRLSIMCPYYQDCGGCQLMALSYKEQLEYKKNKVIDIFKKYTKLDINPQIIGTSQYNYRNKITLHVNDNQIGLTEEGSNRIVPIKKCIITSEKINEIIPILQKKIDIKNISKITIRQMKNKIMLQFEGKINHKKTIESLSDHVDSIYENNNLIYGQPYLEESLSKYIFDISPNSFFQINLKGAEIIYNLVKEYIGKYNQNVLDLYCGTGSIGIYISEICKNVTGIELNKSSVDDAKRNIEKNNVDNIKVIQGNVGTVLTQEKHYDTIIVDPPRNGLDKKTVATLLKINANQIIYVSCNPITLARDVNILKENYHLSNITLTDMFPNTYHVESIILLERK